MPTTLDAKKGMNYEGRENGGGGGERGRGEKLASLAILTRPDRVTSLLSRKYQVTSQYRSSHLTRFYLDQC